MTSTATEHEIQSQQLSVTLMENEEGTVNEGEILKSELIDTCSQQNSDLRSEKMGLENCEELSDSNMLDNTIMPIKRCKGSEVEKVPDQIETTDFEIVQTVNSNQSKNSVVCDVGNVKEQTILLDASAEVNVADGSTDRSVGVVRPQSIPAAEKPESIVLQTESPKSQQANSSSVPPNSAYHIKWVQWKDQKTPIITQNENGPCPLIAIMNFLILKNRISLPPMMEIITAEQLMEYLGDCILDNIPKNIPEGAQLNYEQNMHDAMAILPKLQTGLDVNIKFTGVSDFEYTPECIIFDLLHIPLYHGWLVDPQSPDIQAAVGNHSYNQLVEKIINNKSSSHPELEREALIAEAYLQKSASQLTYHGLCELIATLKDEELAVLFRNNHFITMYKHKNELFQLVTDQGFLTESNVVWETLNNIEGDGEFVDSNFLTVPPKPPPLPSNVTTAQQIDQDYMVALTLQEENQKLQQKDWEWEQFKEKSLGVTEPLTDEELARRLQEEENRYANAAGRERQQNPQSSTRPRAAEGNSSSRSKNRDCTVL
ncbi:ubiquitin carboxyl-terminal hydrolase MINDY-2-like isoform X1 [Centruroides vittatus]|uniref:ubiquitin carboxyl-terminal hydrolase MINDY-2-like isoform X1 n=1 Tax=Centruroides vittatus TaxID=120091 RepID=UPI00350F0582